MMAQTRSLPPPPPPPPLLLLLPLLLGSLLVSAQDSACVTDFNGDGLVGTNDLLQLLAVFGRTAAESTVAATTDVSGDGIVGTNDLLYLLATFGDVCEVTYTFETAAEVFAEAMDDLDPFTPLVAVSSSISFDGDISLILESQQSRLAFERGFAQSMAASLGDGATVNPEAVIIDEIREVQAEWEQVGRRRRMQTEIPVYIEVVFHLLLPESVQAAGASLLSSMQQSDQQIEIATTGLTFMADTASMAPPAIQPASVDCEGSWIALDECSEACGPNGVRAQTFVVTRAEQNGGENCADAEVLPEPVPCNTAVQCPVDCEGEWGVWGACSLPCGNGTQTRTFVVLQEPQHGGDCPDQDTSQSRECNAEPCPPPPPPAVDCVGSWSEYGECSHTCGPDGLQHRTYTIASVASNGGAACPQQAGDTQSQPCNSQIQCPIDCEGEWSGFGPCSNVCGPGTRDRQFTVTSPAQFGGSCPQEGLSESEECDNLCPAALSERDVDPGPITLPVAGAFELATLVKVPEGGFHVRGTAVPIARSYNGYQWEKAMGSPVAFECTETQPVSCSTTLPDGALYQLRTYDGTALVTQDTKQLASRFLARTTFGPTLDEIADLSAGTVEETEAAMEEWLLGQMEIDPSLHRAYLRRRTNGYADSARTPNLVMRPPCQEKSSWVTFAFSKYDQGRAVDVSQNVDGTYSLSIEGVVRTVVDSTKDIREDIEWSCYKRGFRVPLDMPGTSPTTEPTVEACHQRCATTNGCGYFSWKEADGSCHLQAPGDKPVLGSGGPWRTGPADCSLSIYTYPSTEPVEGLENMGDSCWGQCGAHGPCPGHCGANGYCCRYGRDLNGCVTTDPAANTHRCIPDPSMPAPPPAPAPRLQAGTSYVICYVNEYEGGDVSLLTPGTAFPGVDWRVVSCHNTAGSDQIIIGNPVVNLPDPDPFITQQLDAIDMVPILPPVKDSYSLRNIVDSCDLPPNPTVFILHGGRYFRHEARQELVENTVDSPYLEDRMIYQRDKQFIPSLTPTFCPATKAAFTNAHGCVRQNSCSEPVWTEGYVTLDEDLMRQLFQKSQKYVYYLTDMGPMDENHSPCSAASRWKKTLGACDVDTPLDAATLDSISAAMQNQVELETPDILIIESVQGECTTEANGVSALGAKLTIQGTCFEHVHPEEYDVYDMAYWITSGYFYTVPGNTGDGIYPQTRFASLGRTDLPITAVCPDRSCWPTRFSARNGVPLVRRLGVLGEAVEFSSLPTTIQKPWLAELAGVEDISVDPGVSESCGSLGEVANDPYYGHKYGGRYVHAQKPSYWPLEMLWLNAVFNAEDQLRQRVAWALSQIYVVSEVGFHPYEEANAKYFDIFVRHAFGNFGSLIKEVAFSQPMGSMLTFINSKSAAVSGDFADENFARECIQLFTVGTKHLNLDGTHVLDADGNHIPTYGVKDVASFARAWTGFVAPTGESTYYHLRTNRIDSLLDTMEVIAKDRDASPKMDLYDGFIGDGYPACVDLPERAFLRKGFSYAYRGDTVETLDRLKDDSGVVSFLTLDDLSSALYQTLCAPVEGVCTFPSEITLSESLPCSGYECGLDRAPLVQVISANGAVGFFEGLEFACTQFPFFNDGQFVKFGAPFQNKMSCADPRRAAAAPLCCNPGGATDGVGTARCDYHLERVTYATAMHRCESRGIWRPDVCQGNSAMGNGWQTCHPHSQWRFSTWMGRTCSTQVQVQRDGRVNAVHAGELVDNSALGSRIDPESVADVISVGSKSVFDVLWSDEGYPKAESGCSTSCTVLEDTCLCDLSATSSAVFTDSSRIPTAGELVQLKVGAIDPTAYDDGEYIRCTTALCEASDIIVWSKRWRMHEALQAEVEEVNIALNKPTATSSNLGQSQDAWIVDGRTDEGLYHSACDGEQWVQVDLEEVTRIDSVKIYHRVDCCGGRINGAQILISNTADFTNGTQCGDPLHHDAWAPTVNICDGTYGRYVTVRQQGQCLQVMEMEVLVEAIQTSDGLVYSPEFYEFVSGSDDLVYDEHTIFEVPRPDGTIAFYKNQDLHVTVDNFSFRNPPTFIDFEHPTSRQVELETDAVLNHLTTHASAAPFICTKLIKLLTSSNPSPRYVLEVVTAFRTGEYGGRVFSGEYGDLGAAVAAIFSDREARDPTLDLDPAAGKLREPLLKVLHLFRSLDFVPNNGQEFEMSHLDLIIGQQAFKSPSVFNFYLPDYVPAGPAAKAQLNAPEAEILTTPFIVGYMNGIASLVDNGLTSCPGGFGVSAPAPAPHLAMPQAGCWTGSEALKLTSNGVLTYEYEAQSGAGDVVTELSLLLTDGREPPAVRAFWDASQVQYINIALNKPTTASSEWHTGGYGPALVTDGETVEGLFHSTCSGEQWVRVDLGAAFEIDSINIYHRADHTGNRIDGATVMISDTPDFTAGVQCAAPLVYTGDPIGALSCPGTSGRYVTVRQEGQCLQVRELQVMVVRDGVVGEPTCEYVSPNTVGPAGAIYRRWQGVSGGDVASMVANNHYISNPPDVEEVFELFEAPTNVCDSCGTEMDAYFRAPTTGSYVFQIAADDNAHLWFGTDLDSAMAAGEIASVPGWTGSRQWNKYDSQQSAPQNLTAGRIYFLRAIANEGGGGDNLAVGVANMADMSPIPAVAADGTVLLATELTPLPADPDGVATCAAIASLEDDAACSAAGCFYTPGLASAPVPSAADLLPTLIKLFAFSAEYSSTGQNILREHPRPAIPEIPTQNRPYKALIVVMLSGGADSFNMLIPHSGCVRDLYAEYAEIRSNIALPLGQILPMELHGESENVDVCTTFGTHPALGMVKTLWDAEQASWFANIGTLIEPLTRDEFVAKSKRIPPLLFGHDSQQRQAQSVHAQDSGATGVLGRMMDALTSQDNPYRSKVYSMAGISKLVEGSIPPSVIGTDGVVRFSQYDELSDTLHEMTGRQAESVFADTYASILENALESTERLGALLAAVELQGNYGGGTGMEHIARIMALDHSVHESERDAFMVQVGTLDAHQNAPHMDINMHLGNFNTDLQALHTDLVALNLWDATTIVSISDFGRTITSNGIGTDHGWGGNNFIIGGLVKGRRVHGVFPDDINPETSELEVGRGRGVFVPTTPWEGMWYGLAQWFGVDESCMLDVVPNAANFPDSALHTADELFN